MTNIWNGLVGFWGGLSETQRTIIIVAAAVLVLGVLASFVLLGTDYSGFGEWLRGWAQ